MHRRSWLHRLCASLPPGASILDLGCGTGRHALALARSGFAVTGVDVDVDALETARFLEGEAGDGEEASAEEAAADSAQDASAGAAGATFVLAASLNLVAGDACALPFRDASFDAVLGVDVLHWSADARAFDAAWAEAWRVLRPGGLWAARLRTREGSPEARARGDGRCRLESGAEWFLADRALLEARAAEGIWVEAPVADGEGARFILRKGAA